jgi:hypothetical protein
VRVVDLDVPSKRVPLPTTTAFRVAASAIVFEVADGHAVAAAAQELEARGFALRHAPREEPWGGPSPVCSRAESHVVGSSFAPSLHDDSAHE